MKPMIEVKNLSKKYLIYHESQRVSDTLREAISKKASAWTRRLSGQKSLLDKSYEEFWAIKDLNFFINPGDRVGIIGRNGAGKSTLLKVLSRITEPTSGRIAIRGRVASLLEVGTGFHPDLTGRENIFLNGAIMGMSGREIRSKFDEIVAFAEVEKFLDTPVKRFSSGMYTRLGFAIAAHLDTDLLIVDEVLAVGDIQFQDKCLKKMNEMGAHGKTILFVSHQVGSVLSLCNRGIFLEKGVIKAFGSIDECVSRYISSCPTATLSWEGNVGDDHIRIVQAAVNTTDRSKDYFYQGEKTTLDVTYELSKPNDQLILGFSLWNARNQLLARSRLSEGEHCEGAFSRAGSHQVSFHLDAGLFHEGEYMIKIDCSLANQKQIVTDEISLKFPVYAKKKIGVPSHGIEREGISLGDRWQIKSL